MKTPTLALLAVLLSLPAAARASLESLSAGARSAFAPIVSSPLRAMFRTDEEDLMRLLDDPNPEVRREAAKALAGWVTQRPRVEWKLQEVLDRRDEVFEVKKAAIKSLAWATQNQRTKSKISGIAEDRSEEPALRAIALKALYPVASREYDVRRLLQWTLSNRNEDLAVRRAAAWTLFADNQEFSTQNLLLETAQGREELELRAEAVKSLFGRMADYRVNQGVWAIARDRSEDPALREPAVLSLLLINRDYDVQRYLDETARGGGEPAPVRAAAIKAQGHLSLEIARYFHLSHYLGRFIDPLEGE